MWADFLKGKSKCIFCNLDVKPKVCPNTQRRPALPVPEFSLGSIEPVESSSILCLLSILNIFWYEKSHSPKLHSTWLYGYNFYLIFSPNISQDWQLMNGELYNKPSWMILIPLVAVKSTRNILPYSHWLLCFIQRYTCTLSAYILSICNSFFNPFKLNQIWFYAR